MSAMMAIVLCVFSVMGTLCSFLCRYVGRNVDWRDCAFITNSNKETTAIYAL
jgi:hypothetical protein